MSPPSSSASPRWGAGRNSCSSKVIPTMTPSPRSNGSSPASPDLHHRLLRQTGPGKAGAVRQGFEAARGDILMILDADLTVPPEDLPRFQTKPSRPGQASSSTACAWFTRWSYPRCGFSTCSVTSSSSPFLLDTRPAIKDTLCGTKVLCRENYQRLAAGRAYFGDFDPFGDFDLLFGAAELNLKIVDIPIRYRERTYGATNIQRWRHG